MASQELGDASLRTDQYGNLIGAGEDTAFAILQFVFQLYHKDNNEFPIPGIYRQLSIMKLLDSKITNEIKFSKEFQRHAVDLVIVTPRKNIIAVYVNGCDHNGSIKSSRDALRHHYLQESKVATVILRKNECQELFKEKLNYESTLQVCNGLKTAEVKP